MMNTGKTHEVNPRSHLNDIIARMLIQLFHTNYFGQQLIVIYCNRLIRKNTYLSGHKTGVVTDSQKGDYNEQER